MKWISIKDRKPPVSGEKYYWRGKRGAGGYDYYNENKEDFHGFELGDVAVNHVGEDYFEWLDESEKKQDWRKNDN